MPLSRVACIGLASAAALLFQVAQTRLFSASYGYHLTYLVISVSLLGVGSGATFSGIFDRRARRPGLASLALGAAASSVLALLLETHVDPGTALPASILIAYVAGALPFVFASWIVVRSLREEPARAGHLYAGGSDGRRGGKPSGFRRSALAGSTCAVRSLGMPFRTRGSGRVRTATAERFGCRRRVRDDRGAHAGW